MSPPGVSPTVNWGLASLSGVVREKFSQHRRNCSIPAGGGLPPHRPAPSPQPQSGMRVRLVSTSRAAVGGPSGSFEVPGRGERGNEGATTSKERARRNGSVRGGVFQVVTLEDVEGGVPARPPGRPPQTPNPGIPPGSGSGGAWVRARVRAKV